MKRTQLYIDEGLFHTLAAVSREKKTTISDLVRKALARVYGKKSSTREKLEALQAVCGIWKDRSDLPPTDKYIRSLRKDTRLKRLGLE
jgi:hypothetical protein